MSTNVFLMEAVRCLGDLGSDQDPIYYEDEESTPEDLIYTVVDSMRADQVKIKFYGGDRMELIDGTVADMVEDRKKLQSGRVIPCRCSQCGQVICSDRKE